MRKAFKKVLVLGAGPIVIGRSSEWDFAAVQAVKALRKAGAQIVAVNSNPATVLTDTDMADAVYMEPVNGETVKKIIEAEHPDAVLSAVGGENAATVCAELQDSGVLEENGVTLLGVTSEQLSAAANLKIEGVKILHAVIAESAEEAARTASALGYPVSVQTAFTPEAPTAVRCADEEALLKAFPICAANSLVGQVAVQKCADGLKEIEIEVLRDHAGNTLAVGSAEHIEPVGIHSGDSIAVVPAQSVSSEMLSQMQEIACRVADFVGLAGGCNVRFAADERSVYVIGADLCACRTAALISKAAGYPIAYAATEIALGHTLSEIRFADTTADAPKADACAVKIPKWSFEHFDHAVGKLGSTMQATGETFAVGRDFCEAFMKAIRSANPKTDSPALKDLTEKTDAELLNSLNDADNEHIYAVYEAVRRELPFAEIEAATGIDSFFLRELQKIADMETSLAEGLTDELYQSAKRLGFTDARITALSKTAVSAADETVSGAAQKVLVLGSGAAAIGLGADRDYAAVHCLKTLSAKGFETVFVNNNPAAVALCPDMAEKMYIEPMTEEDIRRVVLKEKPTAAILPFGGGNAVRKSELLRSLGVQILGADANTHETLKNKLAVYDLLDELSIRHITDKRALVGKGIEVDVLSDGEDFLIPGICEHIEKAKIHSGDTVSVYPSVTLSDAVKNTVVEYAAKLVRALKCRGLLNLQFVLYDNEIYVTAASVVATRNIPFLTKATRLPIIEIATRCMLGEPLSDIGYGTGLYKESEKFHVRVPVFSFDKLLGADLQIGGEMKSTGEVMGIGDTFSEAFLKALIAADMRIKRTGGVLVTVNDSDKSESVGLAEGFMRQGFKIYATSNTANLLNINHVAANTVRKLHEGEPNTMTLIVKNKLSYLVSSAQDAKISAGDDVKIRRAAMLRRIPVFTSVDMAKAVCDCLAENSAAQALPVTKL